MFQAATTLLSRVTLKAGYYHRDAKYERTRFSSHVLKPAFRLTMPLRRAALHSPF